MKRILTNDEKQMFWFLACGWAGSTLDTPKRETILLDYIEDLMTEAVNEGRRIGPQEPGYMNDPVVRNALNNIDAHQEGINRRLAAEQRREVDRRAKA